MYLLISVASISMVLTQPSYRIVESRSKFAIHGTSSLHDWTMEAENFACNLVFDLDDMEVQNIADVHFSVAVKDIRSESNLMDNKAHDALQANRSPFITFRQAELQSLNSSNGQISGQISGFLTIAGKTNQVVVRFTGHVLDENRISVFGTLSLNMSDYNIEPPTAMLGVLKTYDSVTLEYSFEFNPVLTSDK
ncbi:MAG: YceI family protein [Bacteroidales bacterium]|nr:YceI family protein [Bacteroidales bacterium]